MFFIENVYKQGIPLCPQVRIQRFNMRRYILCICVALTASAAMATEAAAATHQDKIRHVEKMTSAMYVGPGSDAGKPAFRDKRSPAAECGQKYGCWNCSWTRVCAPASDDTLVEVSRNACPKDRPFCDFQSGACVVDVSPQCTQPTNLTCFKKDGNFPHPTDCKKFFYCSNYTAFLFDCIGTYYYNAYSQKCDYSNCQTFNCLNNDGRKVRHPITNQFFAYCSGGVPVGVDRCLERDVLNATSQFCEAPCYAEGLIKDTLNCTRYYRCNLEWVNTNRMWVRRHFDCDAGYSFKPELFECAPGVPESGCYQTYAKY